MSAIAYDVSYEESRNRLTVAFRYILAIPHLILAGLWAQLAEFLAVIQWFIVVFTGNRNEGIWRMQESFLGYYGRVIGYANLLYDEYPAFGTSPGNVPVRSEFTFEEPANRLTNGLRMFWIIPAMIVGIVVCIGGAILGVISWFAIIITGKHPRGMWEFMLKVVNYIVQLEAYAFLMTDEYPKWGGPTTEVSMASPNTFAPPPAT